MDYMYDVCISYYIVVRGRTMIYSHNAACKSSKSSLVRFNIFKTVYASYIILVRIGRRRVRV